MHCTEFIKVDRRTFTPFALMWTAVGVYQSCLGQFYLPNAHRNYKNKSQMLRLTGFNFNNRSPGLCQS